MRLVQMSYLKTSHQLRAVRLSGPRRIRVLVHSHLAVLAVSKRLLADFWPTPEKLRA